MRWWCAASQGVAWTWSWQPYPGVWALVLLVAGLYVWQLRRLAPPAGEAGRQERKRRAFLFAGGVFALWLALDWPLGPLGSGYLVSIHMVQYLLIGLIAPALMLLGAPLGSFESLARRQRLMAALRNVTQPLVAFFVFNVIVITSHWPEPADLLMATQLGSFALDMSWLIAGLVFWWPVISPIPAWPRFVPIFQLAYLALNGILPRPPFFILLFSKFPAYATYELAPPLPGTSALDDQQLAAGIMKLGSAFIMVIAMVIVFARWVQASKTSDT